MWVDGKYMSEPEVAAYIDKLKAENKKLNELLEHLSETNPNLEYTGSIT